MIKRIDQRAFARMTPTEVHLSDNVEELKIFCSGNFGAFLRLQQPTEINPYG